MKSTPGIKQDLDPALWKEHHFGLPESRWKNLSDKAFWVTGAGTGYGRCITLGLAAAGAIVYMSGRRADKLAETASAGLSLGIDTRKCIPLPADITSEKDIAAAINSIRQNTESLHGLINCAALPPHEIGNFPLADVDCESWGKLLDTNITGQWLTSKAALSLLDTSAATAFRLVLLTSEAGWAATPGFGPYNISKAAVNALGTSLAAEYSQRFPDYDIQINVLIPGEAKTEMNRGSDVSAFSIVCMTLTLLSHPRGGPNGRFFHRDGRHFSFAYTDVYKKDLLAS